MYLETIPNGPDPDLRWIDERRLQAMSELWYVRRRDEIVEQFQSLEHRTDLTPERIRFWRQVARVQYEQLTGVLIEQRDEYIELLEEAVEYGHATVGDIREAVRTNHKNLLPRLFVPSGAWSGLGGVADSVESA